MMPKALTHFLLLMLLVGSFERSMGLEIADERQSQIQFGSEYWEGFVSADGSGLIEDLLRLIYEPSGYSVSVNVMPLLRVSRALERGEIDAGIGSFSARDLEEIPLNYKILTPEFPIAPSTVSLICHPESNYSLEDIRQNPGINYAWPRGYLYDTLLDIEKFKTVLNTEQGLKMVRSKRIDCFIGLLNDIELTAKRINIPIEHFPKQSIARKPLYLFFSDNPRSRQLMLLHDREMKKLIENGEIFSLFRRQGQVYSHALDADTF